MRYDFPLMHKMVWDFRAYMTANTNWKMMKNTQDSRRFLVTEVAELLDAYLRLDGYYARNNHKNLELPRELADVLFMGLTTMGPEYHYCCAENFKVTDWMRQLHDLGNVIDKMVMDAARVLFYNEPVDSVLCTCVIAAEYLEVDMMELLRAKLETIKERHGG